MNATEIVRILDEGYLRKIKGGEGEEEGAVERDVKIFEGV